MSKRFSRSQPIFQSGNGHVTHGSNQTTANETSGNTAMVSEEQIANMTKLKRQATNRRLKDIIHLKATLLLASKPISVVKQASSLQTQIVRYSDFGISKPSLKSSDSTAGIERYSEPALNNGMSTGQRQEHVICSSHHQNIQRCVSTKENAFVASNENVLKPIKNHNGNIRIFGNAIVNRPQSMAEPTTVKNITLTKQTIKNKLIPFESTPDESQLLKFAIVKTSRQIVTVREQLALLKEKHAYQHSISAASQTDQIQAIKKAYFTDKIEQLRGQNQTLRSELNKLRLILLGFRNELHNKVYWLKLAYETENRAIMEDFNWDLFQQYSNFKNDEIRRLTIALHSLMTECGSARLSDSLIDRLSGE